MNFVQQMPIVTRTYAAGVMACTIACALDIVSPYSLYYSWALIRDKGQWWRLLTNFFFFGAKLSIDFMFHMFFLVRYCSALEDGSFRGRSCDFCFFIALGAVQMLVVAPFVGQHFLGVSLTFMMVYLWGRRNPHSRMNFLGFTFTAPYLPWVMLAFSMLLSGAAGASADLLGICVGHIYYFLEDVYPQMIPSRRRLLKTPRFFTCLARTFTGWVASPDADELLDADANARGNWGAAPGE
jgi:Derlin-2/3